MARRYSIADEKREVDEAVEVEISDVLSQLDELVEQAEDLADEFEIETEASRNCKSTN